MVHEDPDIEITEAGIPVGIEFAHPARGSSFSGKEANHLWINRGDGTFFEQSAISGADSRADSRTFALFDYDNDGYQDFVLVNANRPFVQLFRNRLGEILPEDARRAPIRFRLVGAQRELNGNGNWSNRSGIGAKVHLAANGQRIVRELRAGEGRGGQNSATLTVGIGSAETAHDVVVTWPSGRKTRVGSVPAGSFLTVYENPAHNPIPPSPSTSQ